MRRGKMRVAVVLDDVQIVRLRELEQPVRRTERQRCAGRVVQHRHGHVQVRAMRLDQALHHGEIGSVFAARHRQRADAEGGQARVLDRPAGLVDQHAVAGAHQAAGDDVERMGRADRRHDLLGARTDAVIGETRGKRAAQPQVAGRLAVLQRQRPELRARADPAQRGVEHGQVEPLHRQGAEPRHRQRAGRLEHPAHQGRRADRQRHAQRFLGRRARRFAGCLANEEATLPARFDEALRLQLIVGGDDGVGTDAVTPRTLAHRRQPRARRHQTLANLLRIAGRQLFGEGGVGTA